jgi:hypothetical protein
MTAMELRNRNIFYARIRNAEWGTQVWERSNAKHAFA